MNDHEMKKTLCDAVDHRLSALEEDPWLARRIIHQAKGEQPVMKKKISVSIAAALIALVLAMSAAVALVTSNIAGILYGDEAKAPQEVIDMINTPQETARTGLGQLSMDEWLFDGNALHTSLTIANPGEETLLYTLDGIWLDGKRLSYDYSRTDGAGDSGFLLGGEIDGVQMPQSCTLYTKGASVYLFDENGKFQGMGGLPEGTAVLKASVAVWRPIAEPELVDYDQYEGVDAAETKDHLTADESGFSQLWLFAPARHQHSVNALQLPSDVYADSYRELGWAERVEIIEVELHIDLNKEQVSRAVPVQTEYEVAGVRVKIETFDMSLAGGEVSGWVYGEKDAVGQYLQDGLVVVDYEGKRQLSVGSFWNDRPADAEGVHFTIRLGALTGELPAQVAIAPEVLVWDRWDPAFADYAYEMAEGVGACYEVDLSREICIDLVHSK